MTSRVLTGFALTLTGALGLSAPALSQTVACPAVEVGQAMKAAADAAPFTVALTHGAIKVGQPFNVDFVVCSPAGAAVERVDIDATMPAHRHGMNYKPDVVSLGEGRYQARNLLFHMPGSWQFAVSVYANGKPTRLTRGVDVK